MMRAVEQPWRVIDGGLRISVRATPRASKNVLMPGTEAYFAARITAPPVEGAANAAITELLAKTFGIPKRAVTLLAGDTARVKRFELSGDPQSLAEIASALYGAGHER